jgi:hypothetical protein
MDNPATTMTDRTRTGREPLPNLRGEDENEIQLLSQLIESMYFCSSSLFVCWLTCGRWSLGALPVETAYMRHWSYTTRGSHRWWTEILRVTVQHG